MYVCPSQWDSLKEYDVFSRQKNNSVGVPSSSSLHACMGTEAVTLRGVPDFEFFFRLLGSWRPPRGMPVKPRGWWE